MHPTPLSHTPFSHALRGLHSPVAVDPHARVSGSAARSKPSNLSELYEAACLNTCENSSCSSSCRLGESKSNGRILRPFKVREGASNHLEYRIVREGFVKMEGPPVTIRWTVSGNWGDASCRSPFAPHEDCLADSLRFGKRNCIRSSHHRSKEQGEPPQRMLSKVTISEWPKHLEHCMGRGITAARRRCSTTIEQGKRVPISTDVPTQLRSQDAFANVIDPSDL